MSDVIEKAIKDAQRDGMLSCASALKIACDLGIPSAEIGAACDRVKIKIKKCQLGCFD